jgi:serine/threonine protein kinase
MLPTLLGDDSMRARFLLEAPRDGRGRQREPGRDVRRRHRRRHRSAVSGDGAAQGQRSRVVGSSAARCPGRRSSRSSRRSREASTELTLLGSCTAISSPRTCSSRPARTARRSSRSSDFGIAKVVNESAQKSTRSLGTPLYMAPEMLGRRTTTLSGAVDRYALGHIAYTLLTGEAYFRDREPRARVGPGALCRSSPPASRSYRARGRGGCASRLALASTPGSCAPRAWQRAPGSRPPRSRSRR